MNDGMDHVSWARTPPTGTKRDLSLHVDGLLTRLVNVEAEQAVLGAMLANTKAYEMIAGSLRAEHFADPLHQTIFELYEAEYRQGKEPDAVTLRIVMEARCRNEGLDDAETKKVAGYLPELLAAMVGLLTVPSYGKLIVELWQRRQGVLAGRSMIEDAAGEQPIGEVLGDGAAKLDDIRRTDRRNDPVPMGAAIKRAVDLAERSAKQGGVLGFRTGFRRFDRAIGGLRPGRLIYLGGRPGMGKSALAQSMSRGAAMLALDGDPAGTGVAYFSAEMDAAMMGEREMAAQLDINSDDIASGQLDPTAWIEADQLAQRMGRAPFFVIDQPGPRPDEMKLAVRQLQRRHKIGLVVVDHVHIMRPPKGRYSSRQEQIEAISMALKELAKETETCVVALAQLSRSVDERDDKRPVLNDLRASGGLEQDADGVLFVYREGYYLEQSKPKVPMDAPSDDKRYKEQSDWRANYERVKDRAELLIAKNRGGRLGVIDLAWDAPRTNYREWGE